MLNLKLNSRLKLSILLISMSIYCFFLSIFRFVATDTKTFLFLNWNLFLAFLPWLLSSIIITNKNLQKKKIYLIILVVVWLLFFPNSPYILTDLFHLRVRPSAPIWFDLILILSFAWTGLTFGFQSLIDIEELLNKHIKPKITNIILSVFLFISSFGIYLGRYLRWNSWDIINEPFSLMADVGERLINPFSHSTTWGLTILMGILLNMIFWTIKLMVKEKTKF